MPEETDTPVQADNSSGLWKLLAFLADGNVPLQAGSIELDENGQIRLRSGGEPVRFVFAYRGADFEARMETTPDARITLTAELGKVPFSMERGSGRRATQRIVESTSDLLSGRIQISNSQDMSLVATAQPPQPLTPASIMAAITSLLLDFRPYIDLLRETITAAESRQEPAPIASSSPEPLPESS